MKIGSLYLSSLQGKPHFPLSHIRKVKVQWTNHDQGIDTKPLYDDRHKTN